MSLVFVQPKEILLEGSSTQPHVYSIYVINNEAFRICFKVQSSDEQQRYTIIPTCGIVKEKTRQRIIILANSGVPVCQDDHFLISTTRLDEKNKKDMDNDKIGESTEFHKMFENKSKDDIRQHRVECRYDNPCSSRTAIEFNLQCARKRILELEAAIQLKLAGNKKCCPPPLPNTNRSCNSLSIAGQVSPRLFGLILVTAFSLALLY